MPEPVWTHRPTWPDDHQVVTPQRSVLMDDVCVGTVVFVDMGTRGPVLTLGPAANLAAGTSRVSRPADPKISHTARP